MKTVLITGAGSGIGHDTALELARRGHHVIATGKTEKRLETLQEKAVQENLKLEYAKLDLTSPEDIAAAERFAPDVLINNAGIGDSGPLAEMPLERVRAQFETNVFGTLAVTQTVIPEMLRRRTGRIVTVTSIGGVLVLPYLGAYNMTKFALEAGMDALRRECEKKGVSISIIEPGNIGTGFNQRMIAKKWDWMSETSAWADMFGALKRYDTDFWKGAHTTKPVVKAMMHAVEGKKPKARYVAPKSNTVFVWSAHWLPTKWFDAMLKLFTKI